MIDRRVIIYSRPPTVKDKLYLSFIKWKCHCYLTLCRREWIKYLNFLNLSLSASNIFLMFRFAAFDLNHFSRFWKFGSLVSPIASARARVCSHLRVCRNLPAELNPNVRERDVYEERMIQSQQLNTPLLQPYSTLSLHPNTVYLYYTLYCVIDIHLYTVLIVALNAN